EAGARDLAGRRPAHQRRPVRRGPRVLLRSAQRPCPGPGRLAHPGRRFRRAARGEHGRAQERAPGDQHGGAAPQRSGRVPAAGGRPPERRSGAIDRAPGLAPLRARRPVRGREHAAARLPRGRRAAVSVPVRGVRLSRDRGVRVGPPGSDLGSGRLEGSGRRRGRGGGGPRPGRVRAGARAVERRCRAARRPDRAGPRAGAHLHVAAHGGADGRSVQEPAITQGSESSAFLSAGSIDITPDRPPPLAGYPERRRPSSGVADPLELNALLLRAPGQTVAILTADLLFVTAELKARLLQAVGARLGLDEASLLVGASHTHTAPALDPGKPRLGPCDPDYAALVTERAAELLGRLAAIDPVPCHVDYRTGAADHAINRRRPGWHVSLRHLPYRGVRRAPNPAGPRDETLHLLTFSDPTDRPLAVLWSYACHPVGFPARTRVSADFPGVVRRALRDAHGAELPVLFLQGFAGDVRPREVGATTRFGRRLVELVLGARFAPLSPAQYAAWAGGLAERVVGVAR